MAQGENAGEPSLSRVAKFDEGSEIAHGLRRGPLPQHRRVLGQRHRHVHDIGRNLHTGLPILRGDHWPGPKKPGSARAQKGGRTVSQRASLCVITSVNRDDLPDGGAYIFAPVSTRFVRQTRTAD
ncbi:MAG: hypothetical protein CM1200mP27_13250 [Chloroflexota bacterium]|nr:MAG: hypothetical protein CM1200mP27_13250 [Chloroflexota bacterium]